jgi:hypothetical protein
MTVEVVGTLIARRKSAPMLSTAPDVGWPPLLLAWLESHVPRSIQYAAAIIVALMVYTLILSMMLPSGDCRGRPSPEMTAREIMQAGLAQIADEVRSMEEHHRFLRSGEPLQPRVDNHRRLCTTWSGGSCNCNRGAFTFSEMDDVESQLLNTSNSSVHGMAKSIARLKPETSIGLENFSRVFPTHTATESVDAAFSVGTPAPGQSRGTGNLLFGANGRLSSTFAYWRRVLDAAFSLIPRLFALIHDLWQRLWAAEARADAAEARADAAEEAARKAHLECLQQMQWASQAHAADLLALERQRQAVALQNEQLGHQMRALHEAHAARLRAVEEEREHERTNHRNALAALGVRSVKTSQDFHARNAAREQGIAARIRQLEEEHAASMALLRVARAAGKAKVRDHEEAVRENARVIAVASARADALRTEFWAKLAQNRAENAARLEEAVALMKGVAARWTAAIPMPSRRKSGAVVRHSDPSNALKTRIMDVNRSLYARVRAHRRRKRSDPYLDDACDRIGRIHCPCVPRPPAEDRRGRARYDARALLAAMNSTRKAAVLHALNDRIKRAQQYRSVFDKVMRAVAEAKRIKRRSALDARAGLCFGTNNIRCVERCCFQRGLVDNHVANAFCISQWEWWNKRIKHVLQVIFGKVATILCAFIRRSLHDEISLRKCDHINERCCKRKFRLHLCCNQNTGPVC